MRETESGLKSVSMRLLTEGEYAGGVHFTTTGTLRVLRAEHVLSHSTASFQFANGLDGRMEMVSNDDGVFLLENSPTTGDVLLHMDNATVADLQWASEVLQRPDIVPGADTRSLAPLGSDLLQQLMRTHALKVLSERDLDGMHGRWIGGDLDRSLQPDSDPELQLPDHVELFVRDVDHAVVEVVYLQNGRKEPVQRIKVQQLVLDGPMDPKSFVLDAGGRKARDFKLYEPSWTRTRKLLEQAEAKSGLKRPSERTEPPKAGAVPTTEPGKQGEAVPPAKNGDRQP